MESQFPTEPAQQPDLGRFPSVQVILGCIKQTIKSKHPRPESSLLVEHMWTGAVSVKHACSWSSLLTAWALTRLVSTATPALLIWLPISWGSCLTNPSCERPTAGLFCSLDALFLFTDQCSTAVRSSYREPLNLYPGHLCPEAASVCGLAWVLFK